MLSIGITGGIGSGKTTVCRILEHLGYPVFYADNVGREISNTDPELRAKIKAIFGSEAYQGEELNRPYIAQRIFSDATLKEKMNAIVHPAVYRAFEAWKAGQNSPLIFNESALLFETGSYKRFDAVILVSADEEERIQRVLKRDHSQREQVLARIKQQLPDSEKMNLATYTIHNNDSDLVLPQLLKILADLGQS